MLDAHRAQKFTTFVAARGGEDLRSGVARDGDRRLPDAAGCGMDQDTVTRFDPAQIVQAVPGGGVRGGNRCRRGGGQGIRQRCRESRVTGDERAPTGGVGDDTDPVADLVAADAVPDRGHPAGEVHAEPLALPVCGEVFPECEEHVGEVDACGLDCHFDLSRLRRLAVRGDEFEGVQIARRTDAHSHPVVLRVDRGGSPLVGPQRAVPQPGDVPRTVPPGRGVLIGSTEQLAGDGGTVGMGVDVDLGRLERRVFGADHAQQAGDTALVEIDLVARGNAACATGHHVQAWRFPVGVRQFPRDADERSDEVAPAVQALRIGFADGRWSDHDHAGESAGSEFSGGDGGGGRHPAGGAVRGDGVAQLCREHILLIADQQPGTRRGVGRGLRGLLLIPFDGEQPLSEDAIALAVLGFLGAHPESGDLQHQLAVGIHDVEIGLDHGGVGREHPDQAVPRVTAGADLPQPGHAERKQQAA